MFRHSAGQTGPADQSYLSRRNFIQTSLIKYDSLMVKKNKIAWSAKIFEPPRQHFGFFEDWGNFGNPQKTGGRTYFAALILRFLLPHLLLMETKLALVRPGPNADICKR